MGRGISHFELENQFLMLLRTARTEGQAIVAGMRRGIVMVQYVLTIADREPILIFAEWRSWGHGWKVGIFSRYQ